MSNEVTKIDSVTTLTGVDINKAVEEAQAVGKLFEKMGVKEATLHNGNYFNHNVDDNTKTVVTEGCIVQEQEHTVTVVLKKAAVANLDAVSEIDNQTQKALGSFVGKSQPWISQNKE